MLVRLLVSTCLLVGAWSLVRVEDFLTTACSVFVVGTSLRLLLSGEDE